MAGMAHIIRLKRGAGSYVHEAPRNADHYWVTLEHANGNVLVTSETYTRKENARAVIYSLADLFSGVFRTSHSGAKLAVDDLLAGKVAPVEHVRFVDETGE
jgi:hypothetical protein